MPLLMSCGDARPAFVKPAPERTAQVEVPAIPDATVACAFDAEKLCLTDDETARVIINYDDALAMANSRLQWLADFFAGLPK